jgi:hypothetical protein
MTAKQDPKQGTPSERELAEIAALKARIARQDAILFGLPIPKPVPSPDLTRRLDELQARHAASTTSDQRAYVRSVARDVAAVAGLPAPGWAAVRAR